MTDNSTISREEANDLIQAVAAQRDAHANNEAQLSAALAAKDRKYAAELAAKDAKISALEKALQAIPSNIVDIKHQDEAA
jgi:predicted oxidoreductase